MAKYVDIKKLRKALYDADEITFDGLDIIDNFPTADVQPVKHGKWDVVEVEDVSKKSNLPIKTIASMWCNQCNRFHNEIYYYGNPTEYANYCPHCGAKMDGEDNG